MEFVFEVGVIQEAISLIFDLAPAKSAISGVTAIKIQASSDDCTVTFGVYEPDAVIEYVLETEVHLSGSVVVSISNLYKAIVGFVPRLGDSNGTERIKFSLGRQTLTLTAVAFYGGKRVNQRRSLNLLDFNFPPVFSPTPESFVSLSCDLLTRALRKIVFSIPASTESVSTNGMLFSVYDGVFKAVSTNGVTLTEFKYPVEKTNEKHECMLSGVFVSKLSRILSKISPEIEGEPNVRFCVSTNIFWLRYKGLIIGSPINNSKFPSYSKVFKNKNNKFVVQSDILLDNVRNILFNSDKDDNFRVTLAFMENEFSVSSPTCSNEGLPLEAGKTSLHIDFNAHLLEGVVKNLGSKLFIFSYEDRYAPVIFEPYDSDIDLVSAVAPLK